MLCAHLLSSDKFDKAAEYRQLLVRTLHTCGVRFPAMAAQIVPQLMEFLSDANGEFLSRTAE
jgi:coatomer subunit beta